MKSKSLRDQLADQWARSKQQLPCQQSSEAVPDPSVDVPIGVQINTVAVPAQREVISHSELIISFTDCLKSAAEQEVTDASVDRLSQLKVTPSIGEGDTRRLIPHLRRWTTCALKDPSNRRRNLQRLVVFGKNDLAAKLLIEIVAECDARIPDGDAERDSFQRFVDVLGSRADYKKHRAIIAQRLNDQKQVAAVEARRLLRQPLFQLLEALLGSPRQVEFLDEGLTDTDEALCRAWANIGSGLLRETRTLPEIIGDYHAMRLYSARIAEHTAIKYYGQLGYSVTDVSIHQVSRQSDRWRTHDIEIGGAPIDVKNSRRSFSSPSNYSEHCIANWKLKDRTGLPVRIAGVLSDYVTIQSYAAGKSGTVVFLGDVSLEQLDRVSKWFEARTDGKLHFLGLTKPKFFPGWVFEYPREHYGPIEVGSDEISSAIAEAISNGMAIDDLPRSLLLYGPDAGHVELSEPESGLLISLQAMRDAVGLSRMSAVMFVLSEFVLAVQDGERAFDTPLLARYIFFENRDGEINTQRPFGLLDTESFVSGMLNALGTAWQRARSDLKIFRRFQLAGANILRGDAGDGRWTTILAYCGGFMTGPIKARCGKSPLVIGEAKVCNHCLRLICPSCGWCMDGCQQVASNPLRRSNATGDERGITFEDGA
jgi:hypothetical protein